MVGQKILYSIKSLPPFPATVHRAFDLMRSRNAPPGEIVDVIKYDQNITATVLRLCNSGYFGFQEEISSLRRAVQLLGPQEVIELAVIGGSLSYYTTDVPGYGMAAREMWRHSVSCALLAQILGASNPDADPSALFTAGLLHDIGKVVLNSFVQDRFREIMHLVTEENYTFVEAEREIIGIDHAAVGGEVADKWQLPSSISEPIRTHHTIEEVRKGHPVTALIYLADRCCKLAGIGLGVDNWSFREFRDVLEIAGLTEDVMDRSLAELKRELKRTPFLLKT